ncbi:signal peptide protein [Paenibacillus chibensis]|uniref:Signal peptide protein n=1 Tax=Paenibacillus chibensis TaxID=59846 RepID=A0ABU6PQL5_9BACL|nr:signal peptide protein [Paenibacillus chibensis]
MRRSGDHRYRSAGRVRLAAVLALSMLAVLLLNACSNNESSVFHTGSEETALDNVSRVPWDYRIVESTVGDLIGSDMTISPDNELMPNDENYATGDKVWALQYMDAELTTDANERSNVQLSAWSTIKTFKTQADAKNDMANLKVPVTTEVDLVGVYKTQYKDQTRNFAVLELPSGNRIKQPIDDKRYTELEKKKKVSVQLEEIHDFADYDSAYAKFRGWAG